MGFRNDFIWGGASASYQIEGAAYEDGKGLSVWDEFCKQPNRILDGSSGDVSCDHYHLYQKDVDIMKKIGYKGYRFSLSWPRILPEGKGAVNEKGLDFYDRLTDRLLAANIKPFATLFHWDYPASLFRLGGWLNPDSPQWFADYAEIVAKRLGDRIKHFMTFNEPQCFIGLGYAEASSAPGVAHPITDTLLMAHHVLLAHGQAVQALRSAVPGVEVGYAPTGSAHYPATNSPEDIEAARQAYFAVEDRFFWNVPFWSDPVYLGEYPSPFVEKFGKYMPKVGANDMKTIQQPLDFCAQNIYNGRAIRSVSPAEPQGGEGSPPGGKGGYEFVARKTGEPFTGTKWPITPDALYWGPRFLFERYKKPIYISENGLSCQDVVSLDGKVHDPNRIDFLHRYLRSLRKAADDGVDIRGYFHWCVTDNMEWTHGYTERFGMVYCDFETQERILKDSAYWYSDVIRTNGENL